MKFINNSLFLIGLIPTPALALKCSLCSGFDDSLDIPTLMEQQTGLDMTEGVSSCAELMKTVESTDVPNSSECIMFDLLAFSFCGCTDAPPAESCFSCPNGEVLPDRAVIPGRDAFAMYGMTEEQLAEVEDKTCNTLAFTYSFTYTFMKALMQMGDGLGGNRRLSDGRLLVDSSSSDDLSLEDMLLQICLPTANACGCALSGSDTCKICPNGLENPDFVPPDPSDSDSDSGSSDSGSGSSDSGSKSADGSQDEGWTCSKGVAGINAQARSIPASDSLCDTYKEMIKDSGCVCIDESGTSGSESGSEDGSKGPDTAVCQECGSEDPETVGVSVKCYAAVTQYLQTTQTEPTKLMEACGEDAPEDNEKVSIPCKAAILEYFECKSKKEDNGSYSSTITLTSAMITLTAVAAMLV